MSSAPPSSTSSTTIDNQKLQQFIGKALSDFGGAASSILVYIGDKLGLYKAMSDFAKPITSQELANLTGTHERYIREWLVVVLPYIGDNIAYQHGLHFCQEVYSYRNQNKV